MIGKQKKLHPSYMKKEVVMQITQLLFMAIAGKAEAFGVKIITGTEVTGFKRGSNSKAVTGVETSKGHN